MVLGALVIPLAWIGYTMVRGVVVGAHPYDFLSVPAYG